MGYADRVDINALLGETLTRIDGEQGDTELLFHTQSGRTFKMFHEQDCCEHVYLQDVIGDLDDLVGSSLIEAEDVSNTDYANVMTPVKNNDPTDWTIGEESETWTFYKLGTRKGFVVLRWYGSSNGYYSESVDFEEVKDDDGGDW